MKNKSILTYKMKNGDTMCKCLLLVAFTHSGTIAEDRKARYRKIAMKGVIKDMTMTFSSSNNLGHAFLIFDCYKIEQLGFYQRLKHCFRMIKTAVFDYIGISTVVVIIE